MDRFGRGGVWAVLALLCACGQAPTGEVALVRGKLSGLDTGGVVPLFSGQGLVQAARSVQAWQLEEDGSLTLAGQSEVEAGRYAVIVTATDRPAFVEAVDAHGVPLARAMIDGELSPRADLLVQPISARSSLQAAVLLELERAGCHTNDLDRAGLRLRFDDATAQALKELAVASPAAAQNQLHALAMAEWAFQVTLRQFLSSQGLGWAAWRGARAGIVSDLDQSLMSGEMPPAIAPARLALALDQIDGHFGLDPEIVAYRDLRTASAVRVALRSLNAEAGGPAEAYQRTLAVEQARLSAASLNEILQLGRAPVSVVQQAATVNAVLQRDVAAAEDDAAVVRAFDQWGTSLRGEVIEGQLSSGLLESWLPDFAHGDMTDLFAQLGTFGIELDGQLEAASHPPAARFDAGTLSGEVSDAWTSFDFSVDHTVQLMTPLNDDHEAAIVSLLIHSQSSFR